MVFRNSADARTALAASTLLDQESHRSVHGNADALVLAHTLHEGMDLVLWKGRLEQPLELDVCDDIHRISFSCALSGSSQRRFAGASGGVSHVLGEQSACISFNPGQRGTFTQARGDFENLVVMVCPDSLAAWTGDVDTGLRRGIEAGHYLAQSTGCMTELITTAQMLSRALGAAPSCIGIGNNRPPLWLLGQSLALVGLILEAHAGASGSTCALSPAERQRLLHARDRLLGDLSRAPTLPELARETNLSILKLKRGFRQLFNNSVYGLFQHERMHKARCHLNAGAPVLTVAAELGYTNASHFSAAFKKQFGVNPSAIKRRCRVVSSVASKPVYTAPPSCSHPFPIPFPHG